MRVDGKGDMIKKLVYLLISWYNKKNRKYMQGVENG